MTPTNVLTAPGIRVRTPDVLPAELLHLSAPSRLAQLGRAGVVVEDDEWGGDPSMVAVWADGDALGWWAWPAGCLVAE